MPSPVVGVAILAVVVYALRFLLNQTDTPKIKNLPEIPGVPIFGNLLQLGSHHAKVARGWAKQYGPVFQTRLGNRVCIPLISPSTRVNWLEREGNNVASAD